MKIYENLRQNDLKYCVSNFISVDEYVSKIDDDNITIAFFCNDDEVAAELKDFVEKAFFTEIKDIEIADTITEDNKYILFVELERKTFFPKILFNILKDISFLTDNKKWFFTTLNHHEQMPCTEENIKKYVRLTKLRNAPEVEEKFNVKEKDVKESFEVSDGINKMRFINEGFVSKDVMNDYIRKSTSINELDPNIVRLLENKFFGKSILSTDEKVFIIDDRKIMMLG